MSTTQPIRSLEELQQLKNFYYLQEPNPRNYTLITLGLNTALRISDLLQLTWGDVYDFETQKFRYHITVTEQKTGKENRIALTPNRHYFYTKNISRQYPHKTIYFPEKDMLTFPLAALRLSALSSMLPKDCIWMSISVVIPCERLLGIMHGNAVHRRLS